MTGYDNELQGEERRTLERKAFEVKGAGGTSYDVQATITIPTMDSEDPMVGTFDATICGKDGSKMPGVKVSISVDCATAHDMQAYGIDFPEDWVDTIRNLGWFVEAWAKRNLP